MAVLGVLVGLWFVVMGARSVASPNRTPEAGAAHWTSTPAGRQVGGVAAVAAGIAVAVLSIALL